MAFPFVFEENFELGTLGGFNSETDTEAKLSFPHYSELWRTPGLPMPFRGAHAMHIDLSGGTADAYVQENEGFDLAADGSLFLRFNLWVDPNLVMATTNEFIIFALQSSGPTTEAVIAINFTTANGLRIGIGETSASSFLPLPQGKWLTIEAQFEIDAGGGNDGSIDLWVDGGQATQVASLDQAAIVQARMGAVGLDAGTTAGHILFDQVVADDARLYPVAERFPENVLMTKSGHVFMGAGVIDNATLSSGNGTDCEMTIYDTDEHYTEDASNVAVGPVKNTAANETVDTAGLPAQVGRGAYVELAGTDPRANIQIRQAVGYGSDGALRALASRRRKRPNR